MFPLPALVLAVLPFLTLTLPLPGVVSPHLLAAFSPRFSSPAVQPPAVSQRSFPAAGSPALAAAGSPAPAGFRGSVPRRLALPAAFVMPVAGGVTRRFDPPPAPWLAGHRGVDLSSSPGAVVRAAGAGRVVFSGTVAGRGVVSVAHEGGLRTTYEPVEHRPAVGDMVSAGEKIGSVEAGHPGCPVSACLHWGLRRGSVYLDPLLLVGQGQVRLKPLA